MNRIAVFILSVCISCFLQGQTYYTYIGGLNYGESLVLNDDSTYTETISLAASCIDTVYARTVVHGTYGMVKGTNGSRLYFTPDTILETRVLYGYDKDSVISSKYISPHGPTSFYYMHSAFIGKYNYRDILLPSDTIMIGPGQTLSDIEPAIKSFNRDGVLSYFFVKKPYEEAEVLKKGHKPVFNNFLDQYFIGPKKQE